MYADLDAQKKQKKTYGGVMPVTVGQFSKWPFQIPDTIICGMAVEQTSRISPAPIYCMKYINEASYLLGDSSTEMVKGTHLRQNNV